MKYLRRFGSFLLWYIIFLMLHLPKTIPAWILLVLYFWLKIPLLLWISLVIFGVYAIAIFFRMLIFGWTIPYGIKKMGKTDLVKQGENKNPYSVQGNQYAEMLKKKKEEIIDDELPEENFSEDNAENNPHEEY